MPRSRHPYASAAAVRSAYGPQSRRPLSPAQVPIERFSYDEANRRFMAEMSDTGLRGFGRVWADSADEGLTIVGTTGRHVVFVVESEERDAEGDLVAWKLRSTEGGFRLVLWND